MRVPKRKTRGAMMTVGWVKPDELLLPLEYEVIVFAFVTLKASNDSRICRLAPRQFRFLARLRSSNPTGLNRSESRGVNSRESFVSEVCPTPPKTEPGPFTLSVRV